KTDVNIGIVSYTDTYFGDGTADIFDTRTKTYYDTRYTLNTPAGETVKVEENWFGAGALILDSFSYTYWGTGTAVDGISKDAKITENYIDLDADGAIDDDTVKSGDLAFIESKYFVWYEEGTGRLILERFEGPLDGLVRASVEARSTEKYDGHAAQKVEQLAPITAALTTVIGVSYTWKEAGAAGDKFKPTANKVFTVTESVVPGDEDTVILTEYTEKIYDAADVNLLGGVKNITRVKEAGILSSVRETCRLSAEGLTTLPGTTTTTDLAGYVTKTTLWEGLGDSWDRSTDIVTSTIYTYKKKDDLLGLVSYTDTYFGDGTADIFDTRTKTYYDTR
ncbi:MAG: hypothetical protein COW10_06500, partial [Candidatus Omnitrophica bacterium CG12_big_fil_rev_8_21_14_0_65_42_8]